MINLSAIFQGLPGLFGFSQPSNTSPRGAGIVRSTLTSIVFFDLFISSFFVFCGYFSAPEKLLKLVEAFVPEPIVLMHPARCLSQGLPSKRNDDFTPLFPSFNESGSLKQLEMFSHCIQSGVKRLGDVQESGRSVRQLPDYRPPGRVRKSVEHIGQLIHPYITP